jgi:hypothetical protein
MPSKILKRTFFLFSFFLLHISLSNAQRGTVSPYSRYGVGELQTSASVAQISMGGISTAWFSKDRLNFINPATYSFDTITTFEAGIRGELSELSTSQTKQTANNASISYITFGFPIVKNVWGASLGVVPYSNVGYNIIDEENNDQAGRVDYTFKGDGGLTRFYLGNAVAPFANLNEKFKATEKYKKLAADRDTVQLKKIENRQKLLKGFSLGFNASWLFGSLTNTRIIEFKDVINSYNNKIVNTSSLGDVYFNFGILYTYNFENNYFMNAGITGAMKSDISSKFNSLWYNYTSVAAGYETVKDTVQNIADQRGNTTIPLYYSGGIAIGKSGKWLAEIDFAMQDWSKYSSFSKDSLKNSYNIASGVEWTPNRQGLKYTQKIQYRFGAHFYKSYLQLNNADIDDYGFSFGFGLPVINKDRIQKATLQLGFEAGQKGTTENHLIRQQYLRFHLGITLNESWFFKRKYD